MGGKEDIRLVEMGLATISTGVLKQWVYRQDERLHAFFAIFLNPSKIKVLRQFQ